MRFQRTSVLFTNSINNPNMSPNEGLYVLTDTYTAGTVWTVRTAGATLGGFSMAVLPPVPLTVPPCPGFLVSTIGRVTTSTIAVMVRKIRIKALKGEGTLDHIWRIDHSPFGIKINIPIFVTQKDIGSDPSDPMSSIEEPSIDHLRSQPPREIYVSKYQKIHW